MSLRQKGQRFRFGALEWAGLASLLFSVALCLNWWIFQPSGQWRMATARVSALATVEEGGKSWLEVAFCYIVDGRAYYGIAHPNRFQRLVFVALPKNLRERLAQHGYVTFDNLPLEVREVLERRGVLGFEHIPEPLVSDLRSRGYASEKDIPPEVREVLRSKDSKRIAQTLDTLLPVLPHGKFEDVAFTGELATDQSLQDSVGSSLLGVWYDPQHPWIYQIAYLPIGARYFRLGIFLASLVFAMLYCAVVYPRLKAIRSAWSVRP